MVQKDYLLRLIEQFSKTLINIIGLKKKGEYKKASELIAETYRGLLKFDPGYLEHIPDNELLDTLVKDKALNHDQLEIVADLLIEEGDILFQQKQRNKSRTKYSQALKVLDHLNEEQKSTFSFDRMNKIGSIQKKLTIDN
ncbi:MAG: hypothetical protein IIA88_03625 [Bacteroidetes bacterium]|nr:hypothetical protein [Bacteroidota bacterium]